MLPVFLSVVSDIRDYLRLAEVLLDKFADALLAVPNMQACLRGKLLDWRFKRGNFSPGGRESSHLFLSSGSSLLRHMLTSISEYLRATEKQIEPHKLETNWPAILDQLGREKFLSDVSQLSAKELAMIHQFARLGEGEVSAKHFRGKFQREYFARLVDEALLIRTGRGRYKLYHPLFGEFLEQTQ